MKIKTEKEEFIRNFIANKVMELRNSYNWSQSELARRSDMTSSVINIIEKHHRMPSLITIIRLADAFDVRISTLMGDLTSSPNNEWRIFLKKFGHVKLLNKSDQKMIQNFINRLKK